LGEARYILIDEAFQQQVLKELAELKAMYKKIIGTPASTTDAEELMDTVDLQNHLKCCRRTLLKHRKAGMPFVQKENGRIYYWKSEVDKYFEKPQNNIL